ncbi:MAG: ABC transporter permease [Alphaproteobacteria bacterium]|nr:MAG: ABC transporter permease [Alphaproteobacteria bacterium]
MLNLKIAFRNLLRARRRSILTGLSMAFGYLLASLSLSLAEGSYAGIIDLFTRDHTGHVQIHKGDYLDRPSINKQIKNVDDLVARLDSAPQVVGVSPRILAPSLAYLGDKSVIANVIGIDPQREKNTTRLAEKLSKGSYLTGRPNADGYDIIMVGQGIVDSLKLNLGDELVLIGQGAEGSIANDVLVVGAIVGTKDSYEKQHIYMSRDAAERYLYMGGSAHEIAILTRDYADARPVADEITQQLSDPELSIDPWQVVEKTFYESMQADKMGNYVSVGLIMLMVSIGVLNTVLMSTLERTREFGLLKAIGTRPRQIFYMILTETVVLASFGSLAGAILALPINGYFTDHGILMPEPMEVGGIPFDRIVAEVSFVTMVLPALLVVVTAAMVALLPGIRAARVTPVRALGSF